MAPHYDSYMNVLVLVGLFVSLIGGIILATSVIKNPGGANQKIGSRIFYLASIEFKRFYLGIALLVLGFVLQGVAVLEDIIG